MGLIMDQTRKSQIIKLAASGASGGPKKGVNPKTGDPLPPDAVRYSNKRHAKDVAGLPTRISHLSDDIGKILKPAGGALAAATTLMGAHKTLSGIMRARKLSKMNPVKRFFAAGQPGRKALGFGLGATAFAGGVKGLDALIDSATDPFSKRTAFNSMMNENPSLKKEPKQDVKKIFNTLYRFNPKMAGDPLVAGSFMRRSLQFRDEGIQPADIKTLTEIGRNVTSAKSRDGILSGAFSTSAGELAGFI